MLLTFKEFAYTTDAQLQLDVNAWMATLRAAGTPMRDVRINYITTTKVLFTALYGMGPSSQEPGLDHNFTADRPPDEAARTEE